MRCNANHVRRANHEISNFKSCAYKAQIIFIYFLLFYFTPLDKKKQPIYNIIIKNLLKKGEEKYARACNQ